VALENEFHMGRIQAAVLHEERMHVIKEREDPFAVWGDALRGQDLIGEKKFRSIGGGGGGAYRGGKVRFMSRRDAGIRPVER